MNDTNKILQEPAKLSPVRQQAAIKASASLQILFSLAERTPGVILVASAKKEEKQEKK